MLFVASEHGIVVANHGYNSFVGALSADKFVLPEERSLLILHVHKVQRGVLVYNIPDHQYLLTEYEFDQRRILRVIRG